jgi:modification methylase
MPKTSRKANRTSTSPFGSPGRVSHDAAAFYNSRLYAGQPAEQEQGYTENPLPLDYLDKIICASCAEMAQLPANSIHLMVTSPPYNVGKEYDADLTLEEHLGMLRSTWAEVHRVLVPGGRACINIANLGRRPYLPLHA